MHTRQSLNPSNYKIVYIISAIIFLIILYNSSVMAMGVRPLVIDLDMAPGETQDFEITLTPSEQDEVVNLNFYQPVQMDTGGLSYQEADAALFPVVNWIKLEQNQVELPSDENRTVKGTVTVPFSADTSQTVIIMIEPEVEEASQGVTFKVRYAIRLNINLQTPGARPRGEVTSFEFTADAEGGPVINTIFHNNSKVNYGASAEATIRNEQGRLVERVELKTPVAWQSGRDTTTIYPGSKVIFTGQIKEPLYPGIYQIRLFYRYANGMQIIERKEITVDSNIGTEQEVRPVRLDPEKIQLNLRPGAASSELIELSNNSNEEITLAVSGRDIVRDYEHSIYKALKIQLKSQAEIVIPAGGKKRLILTLQAPKDLVPGGYYGYIDFIRNISEDKKEIYTTDVQVVSGEDQLEETAEIKGITYDGQGENGIYSVELANTGAVHFIPEGTLNIKDSNGDQVNTIDLKLQEGVDKILPEQSDLLVAESDKLPAGNYTADITITVDGQEITSGEFEFGVK